jgi:hypothetical protein
MLGLALASKFGPAVLLPLWSRRPFPRGGGGLRELLAYAAGLAGAVLLTGWVLLLDGLDGVRAFWSRTIGYQLDRDSPFSIWGQHPGLRPLQIALMVVVALAALAVLRWPRRLDLLTMAALSGALMIGIELTVTHWFYLYIPWFLPFLLIALLAAGTLPLGGDRDEDLVDSAREPVVSDLDRDAHQPDVLVRGVEAHRHLGPERL